jgi:hypothetical protein
MTQEETLSEWKVVNTGASAMLSLGIPVGMVVIGLAILIGSLFQEVQMSNFGFGFLVVWMLVIVWTSYKALSMPRQIAIEPGGWVRFRSPMSEVRVRAEDIFSITPASGQMGYLQLEYQGGKLRFVSQFDGLHVFLTRLQELNPSVVLSGC